MTFLKVALLKHHKLVAVLTTVIIINIFELGLINYKYDIFTGGFLQPYSYKGISERSVFIILSLFFDFSLCSLLASLWFLLLINSIKEASLFLLILQLPLFY